MTDLIIDGNSLFARSYFAAAKAGRDPVQFALRSAVSLLKQTHVLGRVDRALICWDGDQPKTEKKRLAEKPADYVPKLQEFADQLVAMTNIQQARLIEHEADDVVASAAVQSTADTVIIASGDKDLTQLACERISIFDLHHKLVLSERAICDRFHVHTPAQVALALAIQGDTGDGIKGIKGWGPAKVAKLFDAIPAATPLDQVVDELLKKMTLEQQDQFLLCLEDTLLTTDLPGIPPANPVIIDTELFAKFEADSGKWSATPCSKEVTFESKEDAESAKASLGQNFASIFACPLCLKWHLQA